MGLMDPLRSETAGGARGEVLEVGFGTGRNLRYYGGHVRRVVGLDPMGTRGVERVEQRIARAPFPVERAELRADGRLPFDSGRFDSIVTTWTLCSIPDLPAALSEMRRVLKTEGRFLFVEHGLSSRERTARLQERLNPWWRRFADGCNLDRSMGQIVEGAGFQLVSLDRFDAHWIPGPRMLTPAIVAHMYRGVARLV